MAADGEPGRLLLATLILLTVISGLVDAVSYLGLGHVFTANMTGNVVLLGFAAAGASGFSAPACLTSLGTFLFGAAVAGRIARQLGSRRHLLAVAMTTEAVATGTAAAVAFAVTGVSAGWARFTIIAVLAFGMGVRNATIRRLAVPDLTTTVLTMTLTGLAADSALAGGDNRLTARRTAAVAAMLAGAFAGGLCVSARRARSDAADRLGRCPGGGPGILGCAGVTQARSARPFMRWCRSIRRPRWRAAVPVPGAVPP